MRAIKTLMTAAAAALALALAALASGAAASDEPAFSGAEGHTFNGTSADREKTLNTTCTTSGEPSGCA